MYSFDEFAHDMLLDYNGFEYYSDTLYENAYWQRVTYVNYNIPRREGIGGPSYLVISINYTTQEFLLDGYRFPIPKNRNDLENIFVLCNINIERKYKKESEI